MGLARVCVDLHFMREIVKTKFVCKTTMSEFSRHGSDQWQEVFIEGKTYDGEYETWSWTRGYEVNGGWKRYWIVAEDGEIRELKRAGFRALFHYDDAAEIRNIKIERILKNEI
jgi:hypothetical protein